MVAGEENNRNDPSSWARWERVRIEIYQSLADWAAVVKRVEALPSAAPLELRAWALVQAAEAQLALGDGPAARDLLRQRLQLSAQVDDSSAWRQVGWLMIRSFVIEGRLNQAMSMMQARRTQYPDAPDARLDRLQARIALLQGDPAQAFELLKNADSPQLLPLKWLAGLRSGALEPAAAIQSCRDFAAAGHSPANRRAALLVAAEAALLTGDAVGRLDLLEQAVTLSATARDRRPPFALSADDIWQALLGLGRTLGLEQGIDASDGAAWLAAAEAPQQPVVAQAFLAVAGFGAGQAELRAAAQARLADLLLARPHGADLLRQLYLHSQHFADLASIPKPVRYRLSKRALGVGNMVLAARLLATLDQPPTGSDGTNWRLERAQAFILAGEADAGVAAIDALLASSATFPFDKLEPSLFALQSTGRHRDAIRFFKVLLTRQPPPAARQKLLYWLGESYDALGEHAAAARLYLQSATALDAAAMDRWARSARYQAAGALAHAGLTDDARRVYQRLLNAAADPARRAGLRQRIAELPVSR
ncbi:MAG TPA: hypothetical protein VFK45_10265 [Gammaproteobacteria bacterium]|nr:hypothetical protein [Gammaproteobacteria bacterium]